MKIPFPSSCARPFLSRTISRGAACGISALCLVAGCGPAISPESSFQPPAQQIGTFDAWLVQNQDNNSAQLDQVGLVRASYYSADRINAGLNVAGFRIVNGEPFGQIPSIGALRYFHDDGTWKPICTATLVSSTQALTAAHCVVGIDRTRLKFAIGPSAWRPDYEFDVTSTTAHENFSAKQMLNDIALFSIAPPPKRPPPPLDIEVSLPPSKKFVDDLLTSQEPLMFVGYGYAVKPTGLKFRLGYKARVDIAPRKFDDTSFRYGENGKNTCNGDSGGPAIYLPPVGNEQYLIGTTSWGDAPCRDFGVDMRVDAYLDWLRKRIAPTRRESAASFAPTAAP